MKNIRDGEDDTAGTGEDTAAHKDNVVFPFKQQSYHIRRAFDLYGHIHVIINEGIKREAREDAGEDTIGLQ